MKLAKLFGRERRAWPRKAKKERVLLLLDDCALGEPYRGELLDTSAGGLRLSSRQEIAAGTVLWLRPAGAPDETAWLGVQVKHRCRRANGYELGCAFTRTPFQSTRLLV